MSTEQIQIELSQLLNTKNVYTKKIEEIAESKKTINEISKSIRANFTGMSYTSVETSLSSLENNCAMFIDQISALEQHLNNIAIAEFGKLMGYCDSFHQVVMDHEGTSLYQTGTISGAKTSLRLDYNQVPAVIPPTENAIEDANAIYSTYIQMAAISLKHVTFNPTADILDVSRITTNLMKSLTNLLLIFMANRATIPCYHAEMQSVEENLSTNLNRLGTTVDGFQFTGAIYDTENSSIERTLYLLLTNPTGITDSEMLAEFETYIRQIIDTENLGEIQILLGNSIVPKNNNAGVDGMEIHPSLRDLITKFAQEVMAYHTAGGQVYRGDPSDILSAKQEAIIRLSAYSGLFKVYIKQVKAGGFPVEGIKIEKLTLENITETTLEGIDITPPPYDFILTSLHAAIPYVSTVLEPRTFSEIATIKIVDHLNGLKRDFGEELLEELVPLTKVLSDENVGAVTNYLTEIVNGFNPEGIPEADLEKEFERYYERKSKELIALDLAEGASSLTEKGIGLLLEGSEVVSALGGPVVDKLFSLVNLKMDIEKSNRELLKNIKIVDAFKFLTPLQGSAQFTSCKTTKTTQLENIAYNTDQLHFDMFVYYIKHGKEWNNEEMREKLENELSRMNGIEAAVAMSVNKETHIGEYMDWAVRRGADESVEIKKVELAIKDLSAKADIVVQRNADKLGISLPEFYELTGNYMEYPEHWEALYEMTKN